MKNGKARIRARKARACEECGEKLRGKRCDHAACVYNDRTELLCVPRGLDDYMLEMYRRNDEVSEMLNDEEIRAMMADF